MAITAVTARGSAVVGTGSNASLSMNPTADLTVGKIVFVNCASDNFQTTDGVSTRHTVSDSQGNVWNHITEYTETDGATDDGVTISKWWSQISTQISTGDTITLTPVSAQSDMIITAFEITVGAGNTIAIQAVDPNQGSLTAALSALPSREYLFLYVAGSEGEDAAKTPSASYTEQFDLISSTSGALDANICLHVATRIQTATASGNVLSSGWTGTNFLSILSAVYEVAGNTTTTQTISGAGRVQKTITNTVTGVTRIQKTGTLNQSGISRIQQTVTVTITGVASIETIAAVDQFQSGVARIQTSITRTIGGIARIRVTGTKTVSGLSRIQKIITSQQIGVSRIRVTTTRTISGVATLIILSDRTISGVANIFNPTPPASNKRRQKISISLNIGI